ncbi:MAG: thiamine pyrophosphate-dependent enzyme, partial [Gammaproteobacteria bacterium]
YAYPESIRMRSYNPATRGHSGQIRRAVDMLLAAKRPVLYIGGGVVQGEGSELLTELARLLNYPVTNTLMGLGGFPGTDPQNLGMLGMHGTFEANNAMHHADLIMAVGARFDERVTNAPEKFCPGAKIIHVDVDPASVAKIIAVDVPIVGPVKPVLTDMLALVRERTADGVLPDKAALADWWKQIEDWRAKYGLDHDQRHRTQPGEPLKPQQVVQALYRASRGDAYLASDVGQHQMFAAQYYKFDKPRRWINSGGLGTMGFGLPAAMGVQFAFPDALVACITSEGSFMMNMQELSTCMQYALPVKIVNLNNATLGMVKQWQDMQYGGRLSHSTYAHALPDFVALVQSFGHVGMRVDSIDQLDDAMAEVFSDKYKQQLVFLDVPVDPDEHVYPMSIKGGSMRDMVLSKADN